MKKHEENGKEVLAICDEEIIDSIEKSEFYKGKLVDEESAISEMRKSENINLLGNKIVEIAIKEGVIDESKVKEYKGMKHAIMFQI